MNFANVFSKCVPHDLQLFVTLNNDYVYSCLVPDFFLQFVPFRDFQGSLNQYDTSTGERLAKEVLAELPGQIEEFMTMQGIKPKAST